MKIMTIGNDLLLSVRNVKQQEDYGVLEDADIQQRISQHFGCTVKQLYIIENHVCAPALLVECEVMEAAEDPYLLLDVCCTEEELALLYSLNIL